ncbi:tetratricopeptide repeat protein [Chryseobacterium chendengshani]|uniref:tetratricopeptide repeat protein n=1 Tax=Chryseobacterium sp. LJ668 TaxID=2864040 RepID=UPI001C68B462|nr:tetratricopeptide repeat protein [Chryseobacterium sp. LJ668]MBW8523211.1 tetratricopeptide repeat protein [Chryseobacterium sp. LJ668]QYK15505.1 tetratricopeptide repeat protein [Chryseobacterium sp. LJ668]
MKNIFLLFLLLLSHSAFCQDITVYLDEGNELISKNKFSNAENTFRKGLKEDPENPILKSQLALTLINQNKNDEAEKVLGEILVNQPEFIAALWYGGINNFTKSKPDLRKAIYYFEKAYHLLDPNSPQYFAVNYYIGRSYRKLLYLEGLTYQEVDRMLETYKKYVELQSNAEDSIDAKSFIKKVEEKRPGKNVGKWIITTQQNIEEIINKTTK